MNTDQGIYYNSFDGNNWTPQRNIAGIATSVGPSVACGASGSTGAHGLTSSTLPDQLDYDYNPIVFGDGVPVGGQAHLTIHKDGTYNFSGHFHDSGAIEYNMALMWAVKDSQNKAYTFQHSTFESGSRNDDRNNDGQNDAIAQNWANIVAANTSNVQANLNGDFTNLWNNIMGTLGTVLGVVGIVVAVAT